MTDTHALTIDGREPLAPEAVAAVTAVCDAAEDAAEDGGHVRVVVRASGVPGDRGPDGLTVALVSKWERALRRLERLPALTVAVLDGDCGGPALDALLATDHRIATPAARLVPPVRAGAAWPGMALYRLARHGAGAAPIRRALLVGDPVTTADALALHLVDEVTDDPAGALARAAERGAAFAGPDLAIRRQLMFDAVTTGFEEALGAHLAACDRELRRTALGAAS